MGYPLDKDSNQPGVLRGDCPGGEQSKPTYVRGQYPDAYVTFANAAIGEIGSTLLGSTGPFPTTPPPPCVERCSPAPGQNTPECNGQTKARCQQMVQYENKCQWTECQGSTPVPSTSSPTSTPSTTAAPPTSSSSTVKPTVSIGGQILETRITTWASASMAAVARRWTYGRQTAWPLPTRLTRASSVATCRGLPSSMRGHGLWRQRQRRAIPRRL